MDSKLKKIRQSLDSILTKIKDKGATKKIREAAELELDDKRRELEEVLEVLNLVKPKKLHFIQNY